MAEKLDSTLDPLNKAHFEFNKNRKIIITNIPPVTYEEVKEFVQFGGFKVSNISISKKCRHAIVTLINGEDADRSVAVLSQHKFLDTDVKVSLYPNENMLCVTHLPLDLSEEEFQNELELFGPIEKCFLMRNPLTGNSKGYGFVEYAHNKTKLAEAFEALHDHKIHSSHLRCTFADSSLLRFEDLQSHCLLIENLPPDYANEQELQNIFSVIIEPEFLKLESDNRFAVVKYKDDLDAEATLEKRNGHVIENWRITVSFCAPGVSMEDLCNEAGSALLRERQLLNGEIPPLMPPDKRVFQPSDDTTKLASPMVKRLLAENPEALGKFVELLGLLQAQIVREQEKLKPGLLGHFPGAPSGPLMNPNLQIALLSVMMAQQIQTCQPNFIREPSTQEFILNSLQQQQQQQRQQQYSWQPSSDKPSLGSPLVAQANSLLKNVMNNSDTQSLDHSNANPNPRPKFSLFPGPEHDRLSTSCLKDFNHLVNALTPKSSTASSSRVNRSNATWTKNNTDSGHGLASTSSSDFSRPEPCGRQDLQNNMLKTEDSNIGMHGDVNMDSNKQLPNPFFNLPGVGFANPFLASFIEQQIKTELQQMNQQGQPPVSLLDLPLMNKNNPQTFPPNAFTNDGFFTAPGNSRGPMGKPGILGEAPCMQPPSLLGNYPSTPTSWNKPANFGSSSMTEKRTLSFEDTRVPMKRKNPSQVQGLLGEPPVSVPRKVVVKDSQCESSGPRTDTVGRSAANVTSLLDIDLSRPQVQNSQSIGMNQWGSDQMATQAPPQNHFHMKQTSQNHTKGRHPMTYSEQYLGQSKGKPIKTRPITHPQSNKDQAERLMDLQFNTVPKHIPQLMENQTGTTVLDRRSQNMEAKGVRPLLSGINSSGAERREQMTGKGNSGQKDTASIPSLFSQSFPNLKKPHLVPSPEASPSGLYIGQHSQGLGGHYADTYLLR